MITRRGAMVRMLREYIRDGLADIGDFQDCVAHPFGDDGAEIEIIVGDHDFTFCIGSGSESELRFMAVTDNGRDKVKGPIDPTTWAQMSAFVRARIHVPA